jgi:cytochrome P450
LAESAATIEERPTAPPAIKGLPPAPRMKRPLQTMIWSRRAQWMLEQCRARLGPMFTLNIAYEGTWVIVTDPEDVKQIFTGDPRVFHAGEGNQVLRPVLGENSVLVLDEKPHISQRKLLLPPFHGARMQGYEEKMAEIAVREIESWPLGTPHKLRPRMQAITLEIIIETVFGVHGGRRMGELRDALREFLDLTTNPMLIAPLLLFGPKRARSFKPFGRRIDRVDALIHEEIAARRAAEDVEERDDILSMLVGARHEDGSAMSETEIRDELLTLLVAGHETTATSLSWAMERLVRHPEKLERLRAEALAGEDAYLTATIQETLRLRPVIVLVARRLTEPVEIGGYELPAGVTVTPCIHLIHRDPRIYPEPERFLPERFLETPPGTYTWIPFGGGVRRCLGASFAQFEMSVVLRELVARREIRPSRPQSERPFRRAITETPRHDAEVVLGQLRGVASDPPRP